MKPSIYLSPLLLILVLAVAGIFAADYESCADLSEDVKLEWTVNESEQTISFRATFQEAATGWAAIGFKDNDQMNMRDATIVMGYSGGSVNEYYAAHNAKPTLLDTNHLNEASFSTGEAGEAILIFTRPLSRPDTANDLYFSFEDRVQSVLFAYNPASMPTSPTEFNSHAPFHKFRRITRMNLFESSSCDDAAGDDGDNDIADGEGPDEGPDGSGGGGVPGGPWGGSDDDDGHWGVGGDDDVEDDDGTGGDTDGDSGNDDQDSGQQRSDGSRPPHSTLSLVCTCLAAATLAIFPAAIAAL